MPVPQTRALTTWPQLPRHISKINTITTDRELLKKLGNAARAIAIERHDAVKIIEVIGNTYEILKAKAN